MQDGERMSSPLELDVYGLRVAVRGPWDEVLAGVRRDFAWFVAPGGEPHLEIQVEQGAPDYAPFGDAVASFVTGRNVVYQVGTTTLVDYSGRALFVLERDRGVAAVQGEDPDLVREAVDCLLLSRIGEHLDGRGLVRVHAVGLSGSLGAIAVLMPSGGGKSSLALRALDDPRVAILSEESPLLDRDGLVHPFPLPITVDLADATVSDRYPTRLVERLEFHTRRALDVEHYRERVQAEPRRLRHLVIGHRTLAARGRLEPLARHRATRSLLGAAVAGVGVYQGMEFVLQSGWSDVVRKSGTAGRRAIVTGAALRRAGVWRLWLGRDRESNWEALLPLLHGEDGPRAVGRASRA